MQEIRRKEKTITDNNQMKKILQHTKYITIAMCDKNEPYLITLTHGYESEHNVIYFHCASEGKKIDILKKNNIVWGQALIDKGYIEGKCDQLWATVMFRGMVSFIADADEKRHALKVMIKQQEKNPEQVMKKQITEKSLKRVNIGRIDIEYMSGKKADKVTISL